MEENGIEISQGWQDASVPASKQMLKKGRVLSPIFKYSYFVAKQLDTGQDENGFDPKPKFQSLMWKKLLK